MSIALPELSHDVSERLSVANIAQTLRTSGATDPSAQLNSASAAPIGIGALADTLLVHLEWEHPHDGPSSLVAKLPSADEKSAATATSIGAYDREVQFYLKLAPHTQVRVPQFFGTIDVDGGTGILLEDLTTLSPGEQLSDSPPALIGSARSQLAALQAPFWQDENVGSLPWLHRRQGVAIPAIAERMATSWQVSAQRLAADFDPAERELIDRFVRDAADWAQQLDGPFTLCHHDFRFDNMLVGDNQLVVLDWQTVGWGAPMFDVAYLLGTSTNPEQRAAMERDEVARHVDELAALGVEWNAEEAWQAYRQAAFAILLMLVPATGSVKQSARTDAMYRRLLKFGARQAIDLDSSEFLPRS